MPPCSRRKQTGRGCFRRQGLEACQDVPSGQLDVFCRPQPGLKSSISRLRPWADDSNRTKSYFATGSYELYGTERTVCLRELTTMTNRTKSYFLGHDVYIHGTDFPRDRRLHLQFYFFISPALLVIAVLLLLHFCAAQKQHRSKRENCPQPLKPRPPQPLPPQIKSRSKGPLPWRGVACPNQETRDPAKLDFFIQRVE